MFFSTPFHPFQFAVKTQHQNPHASQKAAIPKLPLLVSSALPFSSPLPPLLYIFSIFSSFPFHSISPLLLPSQAHFTMSLSASPRILQPLLLNSPRSNEKPLFFHPFRSTSNFLGSRFRFPSISKSTTRSRSSPVVAVSDVVKEKKLKSGSNLVRFGFLIPDFLRG